MKPFFPCLLPLLFVFSCADEQEPNPVSKPASGSVYSDYQVWAEEGTDEVTIRLQYRWDDEEGEAFAVESPGKVLLDGKELTPDSTRFMGVYYEAAKPLEEFRGKHTVVVVDRSGREHRETFTFSPFSLAKEIPEKIRKKPFRIQLESFPEAATPIRLVMVDTSLHSAGINEELMIRNGIVEITEALLAHLTKGPVTLEIYREEERPLKGGSTHYGKFSMTYGLRRHFTLVD